MRSHVCLIIAAASLLCTVPLARADADNQLNTATHWWLQQDLQRAKAMVCLLDRCADCFVQRNLTFNRDRASLVPQLSVVVARPTDGSPQQPAGLGQRRSEAAHCALIVIEPPQPTLFSLICPLRLSLQQSVVNKTLIPPSGNKHDYTSVGGLPVDWPQPKVTCQKILCLFYFFFLLSTPAFHPFRLQPSTTGLATPHLLVSPKSPMGLIPECIRTKTSNTLAMLLDHCDALDRL